MSAAASRTSTATLDRMARQWLMVMELRKVARDVPRLPITTTADQRASWLRDVIQRNGLADIKVRPSRSETWAQAFERVCGEGLE